jgi:hypothetical protein
MNDFDDTSFAVSPEVLLLFGWLLEHEQPAMRKLIAKALKNGFDAVLARIKEGATKTPSQEELQSDLIDFFTLCEAFIQETNHANHEEDSIERLLIPAINHLDAAGCDINTVKTSIDKATTALHNAQALKLPHTSQTAKTVLCREFLRRWKPPVSTPSSSAN